MDVVNAEWVGDRGGVHLDLLIGGVVCMESLKVRLYPMFCVVSSCKNV